MHRLTIYTLAVFGAFLCLIGSGSSQVTFSKGWGPGKRALYDNQLFCKFDTQPLIMAYNIFMAELREFITCENRRAMPYSKSNDKSQNDANAWMDKR